MTSRQVEIYDTTLRAGAQQEGISLTVGDKLKVAALLDHLGVAYIEGGWPGSNPKDDEFFRRARAELPLRTARLVAFGSTRRAGGQPDQDEQLASLLAAETEVICLVGKASDYHIEHALRTTRNEAVAMVADSIEYLRSKGKSVFFDAEHFFDGHRTDPDFAIAIVSAAHEAGAERLVLCDTNGGHLSDEVERAIGETTEALPDAVFGCHFHNDSGMAVGNSLVAVRNGVHQVQGCINGYGERTGNADLCTVIPNLTLKMGMQALPEGRLEQLTGVSHHVADLINLTLDPHLPYVGTSAFTHKAGLHTSALARADDAYEHLDPRSIGNSTRVVVSELAGRSTVLATPEARELGLTPDEAQVVVDRIKELEHHGFQFEAADGTFELVLRSAQGWTQNFFSLESYRVLVERRDEGVVAEATVKVHVGDERVVATREGKGPVNALDHALSAALARAYPDLERIRLTDFRVRDLDSSDGTRARVRVLCRHTDVADSWGTVGVHENIIDASWQAVVDGVVIGLIRAAERRKSRRPGTIGP